MSEAEVSRLLAASSTPAAPVTTGSATAATPPPTVASAGGIRALGSAGGTVIARCAPGIEVVSATPAQGFRVKDIEPEDGGQRVRFESEGSRVEITLTCVAGVPQASIRVDG